MTPIGVLTKRKFNMRFITCICAAALPALFAYAAQAQTYYDSNGTVVQGVYALPFGYVPLPPGQHNIAPTSSTALAIPNSARYASICASGATVRYTTDGITAPTSAIGQPLAAGSCVALSGAAVLSNFRAISATGTLDVEYFR
jgi:hypothetical protein